MTTIKSYTDISQSKKLAEILPLESADMQYPMLYNRAMDGSCNRLADIPSIKICTMPNDIPCWSLAALHGVLPVITKGKDTANPFIAKTPDNEYYVVYATLTKEVDSSGIYDNPVDACYELILKLHELNLL